MKTKFLTLALAALTIGLSASCDIWPRTTPVTGVTLDKTTLETSVDDFDVKLTATVVPDYATEKTVIWSSDKPEFATVDKEGNVHAVAPGTATITVTTTDGGKTDICVVTVTESYLDYVLIGGKKWATMNLGATTVAGSYETCAGDYYAWGELEPYYGGKSWNEASHTFNFSNWKTGKSGGYCWTSYCGTSSFTEWSPAPFDGITLTDSHDVVKQAVKHGWRLPTMEDFTALANACREKGYTSGSFSPDHTGTSTTVEKGIYWCNNYEGVAGMLFCDGTKKLFFPVAGYGYDTSLSDTDASSSYWSGNVYEDNPAYAYNLHLNFNGVYPQSFSNRCVGRFVRPIKDRN